MESLKTLEELVEIGTFIIERLDQTLSRPLSDEEVAAIASMKLQVELVVTDVMSGFAQVPLPNEELLSLQAVLEKLHYISTTLQG